MKANISKIRGCVLGLYLFLHPKISCKYLSLAEHNEKMKPSKSGGCGPKVQAGGAQSRTESESGRGDRTKGEEQLY